MGSSLKTEYFPAPPPRNGSVRLGRTGGRTGVHVVGQGTAKYSAPADNRGAAWSIGGMGSSWGSSSCVLRPPNLPLRAAVIGSS